MLPYESISDAEAALRRRLTSAETMWFNYTADKSDYLIYCHTILVVFIIFSLSPLPVVVVDLLRSPMLDRYKIQPKVKLSFSEMLACYSSVMKTFFVVVGPLQLVSYPGIKTVGIRTGLPLPYVREISAQSAIYLLVESSILSYRMAGIRMGLPLPSVWEILAQLAVYFVVEDYSHYWIHRWLHCKWGFEKIHRVHHEYTAPIGFASPYAHWAEILILGIPTFLGPAMVPGHIITYWMWIALRQMEAIETHSGYDFPWTPTKLIPFYGGAEYHDYHHHVGGLSHSNFASAFTYCDYIYGTDKGYRHQKRLLAKVKRERINDESKHYVSSHDLKCE